jgi:hypothetical protein
VVISVLLVILALVVLEIGNIVVDGDVKESAKNPI